jgi:uncharacterized protein YkwD
VTAKRLPAAITGASAQAVRLMAASLLAGALASCSSLPLPGPSSGGPVSAVAVDQRSAQALISSYRASHGLSAVELDPALQKVAQRQAEAMAEANELSHEVDGALPRRLARGGADRSAAIENVSGGYSSLDSAILSWKRSPHHNENLLFPPMRRMGIAAASAPKTRFKTFWSLVMTN